MNSPWNGSDSEPTELGLTSGFAAISRLPSFEHHMEAAASPREHLESMELKVPEPGMPMPGHLTALATGAAVRREELEVHWKHIVKIFSNSV
jgi:hypothetical protein